MAIEETRDKNGIEHITKTINTSGIEGDSINAETTEYKDWLEDSLLPRTLLTGTKGMKSAGKTFLPMNEIETPMAYSARLKRSVLLNAFKKTASFLAGQVFQKDMVFGEDTSEKITEYSEKIDTSGNNANVFFKRIFQNGIGKGVAHILVDAPDTEGRTITVKEEKEENIRPYAKEINPVNIIGWRISENGSLAQVRIKESVQKSVGKYGSKRVKRIRLLEPGKWEIHEQAEKGEYVKVKEGSYSNNIIPLITFIPGEEQTQLTGETPLMDLADLNLAHWQSNSDQKNILHIGRVPLLFGKYIDIKEMAIGAGGMLTSDEDNADLKYVEIVGNAISAGQVDLTELESKMALYGLQQLIQKSGNTTATEKVLTSSESNSSLGTWAVEFETCVEGVFNLFSLFTGEDQNNKISVNKEYAFGAFDAQLMQSLLNAVESGVISAQSCLRELKRRGFLDEAENWEDITEEKEEEARTSTTTGSTIFNNLFEQEG